MLRRLSLPFAFCLPLICLAATLACAVEVVTFKQKDEEKTVAGKLVVEADDGILLLGPDTALWAIETKDIVRRSANAEPFQLLDREALEKQLLSELPDGFRIHATKHFLICYNTSRGYAEWCGALYERLHVAFYDYWADRGLTLQDSESLLVALVFKDKESYSEYARSTLGEGAFSPYGQYNLATNRMLTYDLTGVDGAGLGDRAGMATRVNAILSRPAGEFTVATIVHEATHQLAFNSGLHHRRADVPFWLSEGMAMYFETPDLRNSRGWRKVGVVNEQRLLTFRKYLANRPDDSLATLLTRDLRFREAATVNETYAEAWAFNYFLIRTRQKEYVAYLQMLGKKNPLVEDTPDERLKEFQAAFGEDLAKLDAAFVKYMKGVRP
jgi:hypothetical protein